MLSAKQNPPILPPGTESIREFKGTWHVAHTMARFEKALAWDLVNATVQYFLPLMSRTKFSGGRKRKMMMPMFPGYLFFCGSDADRISVLATDRVCKIIPVPNQIELLRELASLEKVLAGDAELDFYPFAVKGQRCRVTGGPFMGIEGVVVRRTDRATLVLQVSMLGRGASLEVDLDLLEPVEDSSQPEVQAAAQRIMYEV